MIDVPVIGAASSTPLPLIIDVPVIVPRRQNAAPMSGAPWLLDAPHATRRQEAHGHIGVVGVDRGAHAAAAITPPRPALFASLRTPERAVAQVAGGADTIVGWPAVEQLPTIQTGAATRCSSLYLRARRSQLNEYSKTQIGSSRFWESGPNHQAAPLLGEWAESPSGRRRSRAHTRKPGRAAGDAGATEQPSRCAAALRERRRGPVLCVRRAGGWWRRRVARRARREPRAGRADRRRLLLAPPLLFW